MLNGQVIQKLQGLPEVPGRLGRHPFAYRGYFEKLLAWFRVALVLRQAAGLFSVAAGEGYHRIGGDAFRPGIALRDDTGGPRR